jgi:type II secretory ATPase GspE/PulE/Tfp pilus assembly ATPase PilB-like protein
MKRPFGTTLISGPTGSGKTTTLYSVLKILNTEDVNIVTLEDPVEYYLEGVNQSQIRPGIGYSFATGLRHILRQDPDIIMVGEIRDSETAGLAIHAALTGHLVFSTIHTNNAIGVIPRLIDMGVDDFLLPSALTLAVAQRLLGKLCNECKKSYDPPEKVKKLIASQLSSVSPEVLEKLGVKDKSQLWRAKGCHACNGRGTKGRIAAFETLFMTPELEAVIVDRPTESAILKEAQRQGMITMRQDGIIKALKGIVGLDDVLRATED